MGGEADVLSGRLGRDRRSGGLGGPRPLGEAGGFPHQRHDGVREPVQDGHERDGLLVVAGGAAHLVAEPGRPLADAVIASGEVAYGLRQQGPLGAAQRGGDLRGVPEGSGDLLVRHVVRGGGQLPDERGWFGGPQQPGDEVGRGLGGLRAGRVGAVRPGQSEVGGVLCQKGAHLAEGHAVLLRDLAHTLGEPGDVAGEQDPGDGSAENGPGTAEHGVELVLGGQLDRPEPVSGGDPFQFGGLGQGGGLEDPRTVVEQGVGGNDQVAHVAVEAGVAEVLDPAADVVDGQVRAGVGGFRRLLVDA